LTLLFANGWGKVAWTLLETKRSANFTNLRQSASACWRAAILVGQRPRGKRFGSALEGAVPADALIDTGAILALLDERDRWHDSCVDAFRQLRLPLLTSEAVLTELFHLVGDKRNEMEAAWKFVRSGALVLGAIEDAELPHLRTLMLRYWDRPMDFADATLVYLAKRESLSAILTVDHADFQTYRIDRKRGFRVVPVRRPTS